MNRSPLALRAASVVVFLFFNTSFAQTSQYHWTVIDGRLIQVGVRPASSTARTGVPTTAPDIGAKIDKVSGIADLKDEVAKTAGYWLEAQRLERVRNDAERALLERTPQEEGSVGLVRVWRNRPSDPTLTPSDENFAGRYRIGTPFFGKKLSEVIEKHGLASAERGDIATIGAPPPDQTPAFPVLYYTLVSTRSGNTVKTQILDPTSLAGLLKNHYDRSMFKYGVALTNAERSYEQAKVFATQKGGGVDQSVEMAKKKVDEARVAYEAQKKGREIRENLRFERETACSAGAGCAEAIDKETRWYDEAQRKQGTAMVSPILLDMRGIAEIPSDTGPLPKTEAPIIDCVLCAIGKDSETFLRQQRSFAKELTKGMRGLSANDFRKQFMRK